MARKPYTPVTTYAKLKRVEELINQAQTVDDIRKITAKDGPQIGYKALCYILGGKMNPEEMKADEACIVAVALEQQGNTDKAREIYKKVAKTYPNHPLVQGKID